MTQAAAMQADLFAPTPQEAAEAAIPSGTMRGDVAGLEAAARRVEVWCGPALGWRRFGEMVNPTAPLVIVQQHGRLWAGLHFNLGPGRPIPEEEA
jgi:hypothetical protein